MLLAGLAAIASCRSTDLGVEPQLAAKPGEITLTPNPNGELFGRGQVRVTMLIPKSAPGNGAVVASEIRNGALLAMKDFGDADLQLVIKDTAGQASSTQAAAAEAVREGASAILGPVFAAEVSAAAGITLPAGRSMIAFSTDTSNARRGVYLLSYTPQADTVRIIRFALSRGARSFLVFLPNNTEGTIREAALRQETGTGGANVQVVRYDRSVQSIEQAVMSAGALVPGIDTIYIPEGGEIPNVIMQNFRRNQVDIVGKVVLGSGAWETVVFKEPQLEGSLYPGRDLSRFGEFAARYQAAYGAKPNVWAALGYDSITLSANLVRSAGPANAFLPQSLENPNGFLGINGIFRLMPDGTAERGLAIFQVENGAGKQIVPAPTTFGRGGS
jgi:hypothetical protein